MRAAAMACALMLATAGAAHADEYGYVCPWGFMTISEYQMAELLFGKTRAQLGECRLGHRSEVPRSQQ